jgi:Flp pilus assembly CpaF family ATPase
MDSTPVATLGWHARPQRGLYVSSLPSLSAEEEDLLVRLSERFADWSKSHEPSGPESVRKAVEQLLPHLLQEDGLEADEDQLTYLTHAAVTHLSGFAPLDKMLTDETIEEVAVIGLHQPIYIYARKIGWQPTDAQFTSLEHLTHLINKMARPLGRRITGQSPRLNALLPDGSRLHASLPPLSAGELTIRRHGARPWTVSDLLSSKSTTSDALAFLWLAFQSDSSVLVAGNTASGKTTLLNALFSFVPITERVLVIEETPEIRLLHPHRVSLVSNEELGITLSDLVRDSLRMRPDRVIVGEVRTPPEAQGFVETLLSGQARGSYATFHAQSAPEALRRFAHLGASPDDLSSLDFIVLQRRIARYEPRSKKQQELRRMLGIWMLQSNDEKENHLPKPTTRHSKSFSHALSSNLSPLPTSSFAPSSDSSSLQLVPLFSYDSRTDKLHPAPGLSIALERVAARLGLTSAQIKLAYASRRKFWSSSTSRTGTPEQQLGKIQTHAYR